MNPLLRVFLLLELLWSAAAAILERFGQFLEELIAAFPDPVSLADATTRWLTSTVGIVLGTQASQLLRLARTQIDKELHSRLIKPVDCFRFLEFAWSDLIRAATNTRDAGLIEWATQTLVLWLWRTFKRYKKLWDILNIKNEIELLLFVKKLLGKRLQTIAAYFVAGVAATVILTFQSMFAALILVYSEDFKKYCLPQDSRRKTSHPKSVTRRLNARPGPDTGKPVPPPKL